VTAFRAFGAAEIRAAVGLAELIEPVARVLAEFSSGHGESPLVVFAPAGKDGDVHVKSAWLPGTPVFTVKVAAWFAARATSGRSAHAVLGTGTQAYLQVQAVREVRPVDTVLIWGRSQDAARRLAARLPGLTAAVMTEPESAVRGADIVITATSSRQPILRGQWLAPGQHVTAIGADDPGKAELDPYCFARADLLAVDSRTDTPRMAGDLRAAIDAGAVRAEDIDAELGELVLGSHPGRRDDNELTVAKLIGLGVQDLASAQVALLRLEGNTR
jgi:ornithine cyclodeaminase/alanine dehydrogenase-like protein (mu-crystallin family)